jgi:hypothetical protein
MSRRAIALGTTIEAEAIPEETPKERAARLREAIRVAKEEIAKIEPHAPWVASDGFMTLLSTTSDFADASSVGSYAVSVVSASPQTYYSGISVLSHEVSVLSQDVSVALPTLEPEPGIVVCPSCGLAQTPWSLGMCREPSCRKRF